MDLLDYINNNKTSLENSLTYLNTVDKIVNCHGHIHILSIVIDYLSNIYKRDNLKYLEIGTFKGASMCLCMQNKTNVEYTGIDLFEDCNSHNYSYLNVEENIKKYNLHNHKYKLIKGNSHSPDTYNQVNELYDIIFIDGDHSTQAVLKDFSIYKRYIKKNGFIIFDDYESIKDVKNAVTFLESELNKDEWRIIGNSDNLLPNKCSRLHFKNHKRISSTHKNAHLDQGQYFKNNEFIIEKL